ncbi:MAG TPA: hypothetical protein VF688_10360 [Allosphingosinicella sp.]
MPGQGSLVSVQRFDARLGLLRKSWITRAAVGPLWGRAPLRE